MLIQLTDVLLILLCAFLPLALGAVHTWSITLFALITAALFNLSVFQPDFSFRKLFRVPFIAISTIFFGYLIFQLIPLSAGILKAFSSNTYKFYADYSLVYPWMNSWRTISIYPWLTISELIKLISYGLIFIVIIFRATSRGDTENKDVIHKTTNYLRLGCLTGMLAILLHSLVDFNLHVTANAFYFTVLLALAVVMGAKEENIDREFIVKIINSIILIGFIIALFGIVHKLSGSEKIYWVMEKDGSHFGPYVNYDHYAGFMSMCTSLTIASFMAKVRFSSFFLIKGLRNKLVWFSSKEASSAMRQFFAAIIMTGSIFYSSSRGGILSFIMAVLLFFFVIIIRTKKSRRGRLIFFFALVMLLSSIVIFWIGPDETFSRFQQLNKITRSIIHERSVLSEMRPGMWKDTVGIVKDFPVFGTGFGTFSSIFPKYRTHEWNDKFLRYTHCDYLQLISETGFIGFIFITAFLVYFVRLYVLTVRKLN